MERSRRREENRERHRESSRHHVIHPKKSFPRGPVYRTRNAVRWTGLGDCDYTPALEQMHLENADEKVTKEFSTTTKLSSMLLAHPAIEKQSPAFLAMMLRTELMTAPPQGAMHLPTQTAVLLKAARQLVDDLPADAVLLLTETDLNWDAVIELLPAQKLLVAALDRGLTEKLQAHPNLDVIDIDPGPTPIQERMSLALLEAVAQEKLRPGAHVVALYNGIGVEHDRPEPVDSLSLIHLGEHLERLSARDLRNLDTQVPLETLRAVVDLATEIGREGREGKPVGTMLVVGDTRRVLSMSRPLNFNPFRGYPPEERDIRDRKVREQIKDIAQLEGAIIVRRDGVAEAACMYIDCPAEGITLSKGLGTRHWTAAAISKKTKALAIVVSQSSGTVRLFQNGQIMLHVEPFARPMIWQHFRMDNDGNGRTPPTPG
jgi:diadenylate cyclase